MTSVNHASYAIESATIYGMMEEGHIRPIIPIRYVRNIYIPLPVA